MIIDRIAVGTFTVILASLVAAIAADALIRRGKEMLAARLDRVVLLLLILAALLHYAMTLRLK